jgi:CIC family chloride channel protein
MSSKRDKNKTTKHGYFLNVLGMGFEEIIQLIVRLNQPNFPVVDRDGQLMGILSLTDIRRVMLEKEIHKLVVAKDIAVEGVLMVTPEDNLNTVLEKMTEAEIRELPVVSKEDSKRVISRLSRKDVIRTYHDEIERIKGRRSNH